MTKFIMWLLIIWGAVSIARTDEFSKLWRSFHPLDMLQSAFERISQDAEIVIKWGTGLLEEEAHFDDNVGYLQSGEDEKERILIDNLNLLDQADERLDRAEDFLRKGTFSRVERQRIERELLTVVQSNRKLLALTDGSEGKMDPCFSQSRKILIQVSELDDRALDRWWQLINECRQGIRIRRTLIQDALASGLSVMRIRNASKTCECDQSLLTFQSMTMKTTNQGYRS